MSDLTLTIRIHDGDEKKDHLKAAEWVVVQVPRESLGMSKADFLQKVIAPALDRFKQGILKLT